MSKLIFFILGVVVGWVIGYKAMSRSSAVGGGLVEKQKEKKEGGKDKIMDLFASREKISNDDVEKSLAVSDATATRYLDELEKEGKIRQVGAEGRFVYYERK